MIPILKAWLIPGSFECLLAGTATAALLLLTPYQKLRSLGRALIVALATVHLLMSVPLVSAGLVRLTSLGFSPAAADEVRGAAVVVVLDAGANHLTIDGRTADVAAPASIFRAFEAARIYNLLPPEARIIVCAGGYGDEFEQAHEGEALRSELVRNGVPEDRIVMDLTSPNTATSARFVQRWLRDEQVSRFVLVTSAAHVRRSRLAFLSVGLDPIVSPAPMRSNRKPRYLMPDHESAAISRQAIYEMLGLAYYYVRGWI